MSFSKNLELDPACIDSFVVVQSKNDFPVPVGDLITLDDRTTYSFVVDLDIGNCIFANPNGTAKFVGIGAEVIQLKTSNSNPMITMTNDFVIDGMELINDAGPCIDFDVTSGLFFLILSRIISASPDKFKKGGNFVVILSTWAGGKGAEISGAWSSINILMSAFSNLVGSISYLTLDSTVTVDTVRINQSAFAVTSSGQIGLDIDSGILPTITGAISDTIFDVVAGSDALAPGGVDQTTVGWNFRDCPTVMDSASVGAISYDDNPTATTIASTDVYQEITTTIAWALDPVSERFQLNADGKSLEYLGRDTIKVLITSGVFLSSANNNLFRIGLFRNSIFVDEFTVDIRQNPITVVHNTILDLTQDDVLELKVKNVNNMVNPTVIMGQITAVKGG